MIYRKVVNMIIGTNDNLRIFVPTTGENIPVKAFPSNRNDLEIGVYYPIGEYVYKYIGKVERFKDIGLGNIAFVKSKQDYFTNAYSDTDDDRDYFHICNIVRADAIDDDMDNIDSLLVEYHDAFSRGCNIMKGRRIKSTTPDGVFLPELKSTDDALTRTMKKMIIHKQIIPSEYRSNMGKEYSFDNMRSALAGATINMTISKFLAWCKLLNLDWEFQVFDNGLDTINPLSEVISISNAFDIVCDCGEPERGIFKIPINPEDDPLKKLIKCAIIKKHMNIADYKDKGSTPYLLNNMRGALKSKSKMMMPYFISWCEVLGLHFVLRIIDPVDGMSFEANETFDANDYSINEGE